MSRLHSLQMSPAKVAALLGVSEVPTLTIPSQLFEGDQGIVVFEAGGQRVMRRVRWGFPRIAQGIIEPGLIGLVADLTNPMWEGTVVDPRYRCVIPITHFGNPGGKAGGKTRTWFSVKDQAVMAWAGFCRNIPGTGPVYAGMTMAANAAVTPTNDRMPALLEHGEIDRWLHGSLGDVIGFQFRAPFDADRMQVARTQDPWRGGAPPPMAVQPTLL